MNLLNAVIHQVVKQAGSADMVSHEAEAELAPSATLDRVASEARQLYKGRAVYGVFQTDQEMHWFQARLAECAREQWGNFLGFTVRALALLMDKMKAKTASVGGYVLFLRYRENEEDYLFVLMLNDKVGASVTRDLALKEAIHLDMSKLYVAARINLSRWQQETQDQTGHKYLSFIRGRRDISDYFIDFIGGTDVIKPKEATDKVINILNDYVREKGYQGEQRDRCREVAASYLKECAESGQEASLDGLSARLDVEAPSDFVDFAAAEEYEMSQFFHVHKQTLSRLTGVVFSGGGLSLKMSERYVKEHVRVEGDQVIITGVPQDLQQEIQALL